MSRTGLLLLGTVVVAAGCGPSMPRGFNSPEPAARIDAMVAAARTNDRSAVPKIVPLLESDDPATRLVAIRTLERLTGETLGYDYAAAEGDREEAVERWRRYAGGAGAPTGSAAES